MVITKRYAFRHDDGSTRVVPGGRRDRRRTPDRVHERRDSRTGEDGHRGRQARTRAAAVQAERVDGHFRQDDHVAPRQELRGCGEEPEQGRARARGPQAGRAGLPGRGAAREGADVLQLDGAARAVLREPRRHRQALRRARSAARQGARRGCVGIPGPRHERAVCAVIARAAAVASVTPLRVTSAPTLDGRLDDEVWSRAAPFTAFVQKAPDAGAPASEPVSVRLVYDETSLWVGLACTQQRSPIVARLTRRDRQVDSDHVEIDLDSRATGRDAFHFEVNAAGVLIDALRYNDTDISYDWDENWEARVATTPTGWSAEIRIPFRVLRYARVPGERWGLQVRRFISARQELDELAPLPRGEAGAPSRYGSHGPVEAQPDQPGIELRPFVLGSMTHASDGL